MTLDPIFNAPVYIQIHACSAIFALVLGPFVILRNRRDRLHKIMGYLWVLAMATTALSSFWIQEFKWIGPFSPIHGLSCFALFSLYRGVSYAIAGEIKTHRKTFRTLYVLALLVTGLFTLLPGRIMNQTLFGNLPQLGLIFLAGGLITLAIIHARRCHLRRARTV